MIYSKSNSTARTSFQEISFRYTCPESGETISTSESALKLYCNIRGGANEENKVNFMFQVGLEEASDLGTAPWP